MARRGHFTAEGWATCRCGKETHHFVREETQELADKLLGIHLMSLCKSCSMDAARRRDECPESVWTESAAGRGVVACGLGWAHTGRCEPAYTPDELAAILAATPRSAGGDRRSKAGQ